MKNLLNHMQGRAIDLYLSPAEIRSPELQDKIVVVIDVLRASTSIVTALNNGAKSVIPVAEVETARDLAAAVFDRPVLLCGERNEMRIDGFDLSNSPLEYAKDIVTDKTIIFTSSNGARLFDYAKNAARVVVGAFVNVTALSGYIATLPNDVALLCAGKNGRFGLEDVVCGGMMVCLVVAQMANPVALNDAALAAGIMYQNYAANITEMLYQASHGKRLIEIGQEHDLKICGAVDAISAIPVLKDGELILSRMK